MSLQAADPIRYPRPMERFIEVQGGRLFAESDGDGPRIVLVDLVGPFRPWE